MGVLHVDARQYLDGCKPILMEKRLGLFLCAGFADKADALFENNVDPGLRAHAVPLRLLWRRGRYGQAARL